MDLALSSEQAAFREEVRTFLQAELTPAIRRGAAFTSGVFAEPDVYRPWQAALEARGWLTYFWPEHAGGPGWGAVERWIFESECARAGAPLLPGMGLKLVGPVLYTYGTQEQKARFLPALRTGEHVWAQGFSEPGAGSDLASLRTRAIREGGDYIVTGQKIWTTQAQFANWLFALVRTDPEVKPQAGISFLLIDMASPGITVRPIHTIDGYHHVNEVFFDNVEVPAANLIGEEGRGWDYAKFLLGQERTSMGNVGFARRRLDRVRARAAARGMLSDPAFARRLKLAEIELKALEITQMRVVASERAPGAGVDPKVSILKIKGGELLQTAAALLLETLGPEALTAGFAQTPEADFQGLETDSAILSAYFSSRKYSIFGGSSEVQRGILAKAVLGLGRAA